MPERKALMTTALSALPLHIAAHEERAIPASPWLHIAAVHQDILLTFDGQESFRLLPGDEVIVRRASAPVRIVKFDDKNYYHTLKNKLWRNG